MICAVCGLEAEIPPGYSAPVSWLVLDVAFGVAPGRIGPLLVCGMCICSALSHALKERLAELDIPFPTAAPPAENVS